MKLPSSSRFANLGLNVRLARFVRWKDPSPGLSAHTPIYAHSKPTYQLDLRPSNSDDEEDIADLEAKMVPAALRQGYRDGGALSLGLPE